MRRFRIIHRTYYAFSGVVTLGPHKLLLRPREGHDLRIESSQLDLTPRAVVRWHRDVENNSVATAEFSSPASRLAIESEVEIQQYNQEPLDFVVDQGAAYHPFEYPPADRGILAPYLAGPPAGEPLRQWASGFRSPGESVQSYVLLERINTCIYQTFRYVGREEPGVQTAERTLATRSGSCRDFAVLFMAAARHLGMAARFVSGYVNAPPSVFHFGATHAWAEVYLPGAGWKGFDPTTGRIAGPDNIPVAVSRDPESVPPVAGSFFGCPGATMTVGVWVSEVEGGGFPPSRVF